MSRRGENIYKRKDGRWEGRYPKGRKENGQLHYGYVYGKSYKEVKHLVITFRGQYQQLHELRGEYVGSVQQWITFWLKEEVYQKVKDSTLASYQHKLQRYILPEIGEYQLNQVTLTELQNLVTIWKTKGLSASTIRILAQLIKKSFTYAYKQNYILVNPCEGLRLPKRKMKAIQALTVDEQRQLEKQASNSQKGVPILLALHTGLRIGEIAALRWQDIDLREQIIRVKHTYQRIPLIEGEKKTQLVYSEVKTESSLRSIPFSNAVKDVLVAWQRQQKSPFVFGKGEKPIEPRTLTNHFRQIIQAAKLKPIHFHQLRHTFATRCMEAKGNVAAISALLGHASTKMTLDVYTDGLMEQRRQVIQAMETNIN